MSAAAAPPGEEGAAAGEGRGRAPSTTRAKAGSGGSGPAPPCSLHAKARGNAEKAASGGSGPAPAPLLQAEARGRGGGGRRRLQAMPRMGPAGRARGGRRQLGPVAASFAEGLHTAGGSSAPWLAPSWRKKKGGNGERGE